MSGPDAVPETAATGTILIMAAERGGCRRLAADLRRRGLGVLEPETPADALGLARGARPDVVALDLRSPGVMFVIDRLHGDDRRGRPAIALLVPHGITPVPSIVPAHGVEVVESDPDDPGEAARRLIRLAERRRELRASSPLTGLPGNAAIRAELEDRFAVGRPTALLYVDLDAFKPYNDRYGFLRGDEVLRLVASLLVAEARRHPGAFVGHIGGDDFVLLVAPEEAEATAHRITSSFDLIAPHLYDPADSARGRLVGRDRLGRLCRWPLLSLSVGVARSDRGDVRGALELTDIATEMKRVAKRIPGSAVAVDQRTGQDPPVRWRVRALATLVRPSLRRVASSVAAVLLAAVLFVPAGGAIAMAKPGEVLWPAARLMQDLRLGLADPENAVPLRLELAAARLDDALTAFSIGDDERAAAALAEYRHRYGQAVTLLTSIEGGPSRERGLVQLAETGGRQAAILASLVESRCGQAPGGAPACVELQAALASVTRTPAGVPPAGTAGEAPRRAPDPAADQRAGGAQGREGSPGGSGGATAPGSDGGAGNPAGPQDPGGADRGSGSATPGAATGTPAPTGDGSPGAGGGGTPGAGAGDAPEPGAGEGAGSPAPATTQPTDPEAGGPDGTTPGPPPAAPATPGPTEPPATPELDPPSAPPGSEVSPPPGRRDGGKDGRNHEAPEGPPEDRGPPPDRPGAERGAEPRSGGTPPGAPPGGQPPAGPPGGQPPAGPAAPEAVAPATATPTEPGPATGGAGKAGEDSADAGSP